jgi:hypothetical protein
MTKWTIDILEDWQMEYGEDVLVDGPLIYEVDLQTELANYIQTEYPNYLEQYIQNPGDITELMLEDSFWDINNIEHKLLKKAAEIANTLGINTDILD